MPGHQLLQRRVQDDFAYGRVLCHEAVGRRGLSVPRPVRATHKEAICTPARGQDPGERRGCVRVYTGGSGGRIRRPHCPMACLAGTPVPGGHVRQTGESRAGLSMRRICRLLCHLPPQPSPPARPEAGAPGHPCWPYPIPSCAACLDRAAPRASWRRAAAAGCSCALGRRHCRTPEAAASGGVQPGRQRKRAFEFPIRSAAKIWATVFSAGMASPSLRCGVCETAPGGVFGHRACQPAVAFHDSSALVPGVPEVRGGHLQQVRSCKKKGLGLQGHDGGHLTRGGRGTPG